MVHRKTDTNVVSMRPSHPSPPDPPPPARRPPLHPTVRRRRRLWLLIMVAFFLWSGVQLVQQTMRIEAQKAVLAEKREAVEALEKEHKELKEEIRLLHNDEYVTELARKWGYRKPGEQLYETP